MSHSRLSLVGFVFIFFFPILVFALDTATSGRILDAFKTQEYQILFENESLDQSGSLALLEKEIALNGIDAFRKKLSDVTLRYDQKRSEYTRERQSLESTLSLLSGSIARTESSLRTTERSLLDTAEQVQDFTALSLEFKRKIHRNRTVLLGYLSNMYSEGNLLYDENNTIDTFRTLLMTDGSTDVLVTDMTYKSLVALLGQQFIDEYRSLIREYARISLRLQSEIRQLDALKKKLSLERSTLLSQKKQQEELLEVTQGKEELYVKYVASQEKMLEKSEKAWQEAQLAYTTTLSGLIAQSGCSFLGASGTEYQGNNCEEVRAYYEAEKELRTQSLVTTGSQYILDWPSTSRRISTHFRQASYYDVLGSHHDAIDIAIDQSSPVLAAADGYVQYILPPVSGGYSYLAIRHPDGYVTVYGHLSEVHVSRYDRVKKGDLIARSGGEPGTPGAGPMTSGAHLHFEVWKNREPIDPLRVLSIATIDYESLPSKYQEKFLEDYLFLHGSGSDISSYERKFLLKGKTEEDRQKYLLDTYAASAFQNWEMWHNTALEARIDPSFLMCVGLSETLLGNRLKSSYNVGNVGNTDSGGVYDFSSPSEGVFWMGLTFNNKYLSGYNHLDELSRWGNSSGSIYASSQGNWHNNIIRCLSALKGRYVEDDYGFRIP